MKSILGFAFFLVTAVALVGEASAQDSAKDPSTRLRQVLPPDVAQRVLNKIADARAHQLPAEALENRALKFAAKGIDPKDIERSVSEQADRMVRARTAIMSGRAAKPLGDEIEAGAEAIRKGFSGEAVRTLAKSAPSGRSLAIPLFVIGSLTDRGLPSDQALKRVLDRLKARASDNELEALPGEVSGPNDGVQTRERSETKRGVGKNDRPPASKPAGAGAPKGVPGNAGRRVNPRRQPPRR
jgi:hypothetical protein